MPPNSKSTINFEYPDMPRVAVGAIVFYNDKILLVRRAKAPSRGLWAIPGGSVELGETLQEAAEREIMEETGIRILAGQPAYTFEIIEKDDNNRIRFHYVVVDLIADYISGEPCPGDDADEVRWISFKELKNLNISSSTLDVLKLLGKIIETRSSQME